MPGIQDRSKRFGVAVRKDGNKRNPQPDLRSSEFGDPVNFFYPVTDKGSALAAKAGFLGEKDVYASADESQTFNRSIRVITSRLNRLFRKFKIPVFEPAALTMSLTNPLNNLSQTLPVELSLSDSGDILIPAARVATLWHPWFGALHLDDDLFDSFMDNRDTNVVGRELSVDIDHGRSAVGSASMAWVNDMFLDRDIFFMQAEPTDAGREVLGTVFKYASISYQDNYVDPETRVNFGPTLLGVAATNSPFVRGNPPMAFVPPKSPPSLSFGPNVGPLNNFHKESQMPDTGQTFQLGDRQYTAEELQAAIDENNTLRNSVKQGRIESVVSQASTRGVPPALTNLAAQMLEALEPSAAPTLSLTVPTGEDDGAGENQFNLFGAIEVLLAIAPGRIDDEGQGEGSGEENPRSATFIENPYALEAVANQTPEEAEAAAIARRAELNITTTPQTNGAAVPAEVA